MPQSTPSIQRNKNESVLITLDSPEAACGFGGHVSIAPDSAGLGNGATELFFHADDPFVDGGDALVFHLYETHSSRDERLQHHRVDLGPKPDLERVQVVLGTDSVEVHWRRGRIANDTYELVSSVPLSSQSALWAEAERTLYYTHNGLLASSGKVQSRGFDALSVEVSGGYGQGDGEGGGGADNESPSNTGGIKAA